MAYYHEFYRDLAPDKSIYDNVEFTESVLMLVASVKDLMKNANGLKGILKDIKNGNIGANCANVEASGTATLTNGGTIAETLEAIGVIASSAAAKLKSVISTVVAAEVTTESIAEVVVEEAATAEISAGEGSNTGGGVPPDNDQKINEIKNEINKRYRQEIDLAEQRGDIEEAENLRYDRYCELKEAQGEEPLNRDTWNKKYATIKENSAAGYANETKGREALDKYLKDCKVTNNNEGTVITHTYEGTTVRPDSIITNAEGEITGIHDHKHFTGKSQTQEVYYTAQLKAEKDMGDLVVTMSSDVPKLNSIPPEPRPSRTLASTSDIYYVDTTSGTITYRWKADEKLPGGGLWKKV